MVAVLAVLAVLAIGVVMMSVFGPTVIDGNRKHSVGMLIETALWAYKDENGHAPESLVEIQPFLERATGWACRITEPKADQYQIEMHGGHRTYYVDIEYRADHEGKMEEYRVVSIDSRRRDKRVRSRRQ